MPSAETAPPPPPTRVPSEDAPPGLSRRRMLTYLVAAPALTVAVTTADRVPGFGLLPEGGDTSPAGALPSVADVADLSDALNLAALPTAYLLKIEVTPEDRVTVHLPRAEVGQGLTTAFALIAAEELDTPLDRVDVVLDDARPELLFNQLTGGSNSIHSLYGPMRAVAAGARARLVTAAAQQWDVSAGALVTVGGSVTGPGGRTASFGSLSALAATITTPAIPGLPKPDSQLTTIGRPTGRVDARDIVTGRARYAQDLPVPDAKVCVVARPPTINGTVRSFDASAARSVPGVLDIAQIPTGIAVVAETFSQAEAGRDALQVSWGPGTIDGISDADIQDRLERATLPFTSVPLGQQTVERRFDFAAAPHAPLETLTATADVRADRAEIWFGAKSPIIAAQAAAAAIGLPQSAVTLHVVRTGGSFGHRLFFEPAIESAQISKAVGRPVRLIWTRNDDTRHGRLRPPSHHKVRATHLLGRVLAYEHRHATLPVDFSHGLGDALSGIGFDVLSAGATQSVFALTQKVPYQLGLTTQLLSDVPLDIPTGSWRGIYSGQTATVNEIMVDEIARALRRDPVTFRRQTLKGARAKAVLERVVADGQWGRSLPAGVAQGVGLHDEYKSVCAFLVEVDARDPANPRVTRGTCAVDVGRAVNPTGLEAQMQGALIDGLSIAFTAGVHIDDGAVREGSYGDYRFARMANSPPTTDVHVMAPTGEPGGAGELGLPAATAAVANAYARATGTTPTRFPIAF